MSLGMNGCSDAAGLWAGLHAVQQVGLTPNRGGGSGRSMFPHTQVLFVHRMSSTEITREKHCMYIIIHFLFHWTLSTCGQQPASCKAPAAPDVVWASGPDPGDYLRRWLQT